MTRAIEKLPSYLRKYCVTQEEGRYTPRDQAAWRYIMRQSRAFFADHAVPIYLDGLKRTGITVDRIPLIAEMDAKLAELGWGAVPVCGFIPPAAFLDFQARRILPIAYDMRSPEHIAYTPAPDIVHEAAGHAPIIADPQYADYLTMYAAMAQKAIFSQEDLDLYDAIRTLSDSKENPDSSALVIASAEAALARATRSLTSVSEANKVARMNWWTVEYGLLGSLQSPKIYGAGLLSSVGESQNCLSSKVRKIRLSAACVEQTYDITEPQPQLYVADNIPHLVSVLKEFEQTLAYTRGGIYGLEQAKAGRTVTTTVLDSQLQVSGKLAEFTHVQAANGTAVVDYLHWQEPVQLAAGGKELAGQGTAQHATGFSTPLGRFLPRADKHPCHLTDSELAELGIIIGRRARLSLATGFVITGTVAATLRLGAGPSALLALIKWQDCQVTRAGKTYFKPAWGDFDMAVGEKICSVFGGPADRESYGSSDLGMASTTPGRKSPYTDHERAAFAAYADVRRARSELKASASSAGHEPQLIKLISDIAQRFPQEWLLRLETLELGRQALKAGANGPLTRHLNDSAAALSDYAAAAGPTVDWLVRQGTQLAGTAD